MRSFFILILSCFSFFSIISCKKDKKIVDSCKNGFLDPGETKPDCGGNCAPCVNTFLNHVYSELNGKKTNYTTKNFNFNEINNSWTLTLINDSLRITIGSGPNGGVGTYYWDQSSKLTLFNQEYPTIFEGTISISKHDTDKKVASGYFFGDFIRPASQDTIKIREGSFTEISY